MPKKINIILCAVWKIRSYAKFYFICYDLSRFACADVYVTDTHTYILFWQNDDFQWPLNIFLYMILLSCSVFIHKLLLLLAHRNFFSFLSVSIWSKNNFWTVIYAFKFKWIRRGSLNTHRMMWMKKKKSLL